MSATPSAPLAGFEQRLLDELRTLVQQRATQQHNAMPRTMASARRAPRRSRPMLAGAATIAAVAALVALIVSAEPGPSLAQAFPIFARPATAIPRSALASILHAQGATVHGAQLDADHARAFPTPLGTGYVVTDTHANTICVAAPGFANRGWGAACGSADKAERYGAGGLENYGSAAGQVSYVEILPAGATATIRRPGGGHARALPTPDGVLAVIVRHPSIITTQIAGHIARTLIQPPARSPRMPVPTHAQVAAPVHWKLTPGRRFPLLSATFRTRYPAHAGASTYVLEYAPLPDTHPACHGSQQAGDTIDEQTSRDIPAGTLLTLRGGAPNCSGRWRATVYLAVTRGQVIVPGQAWPQPLDGATKPTAGSGEQIVASKTLTIH